MGHQHPKQIQPHIMLGSKYVALFNREHINELSAQAKWEYLMRENESQQMQRSFSPLYIIIAIFMWYLLLWHSPLCFHSIHIICPFWRFLPSVSCTSLPSILLSQTDGDTKAIKQSLARNTECHFQSLPPTDSIKTQTNTPPPYLITPLSSFTFVFFYWKCKVTANCHLQPF